MQKVLIVDDDPDTLEVMQQLVRGWGYEVLTALSGSTALTLVHEDCPDIVLSDFAMPEMTGIELLRAIRRDVDKTCPVVLFVMVTGRASGSDVVEAIHEGADDYVAKPVNPDKLRVLLEKAIGPAGGAVPTTRHHYSSRFDPN